jgi:hypothetical protein
MLHLLMFTLRLFLKVTIPVRDIYKKGRAFPQTPPLSFRGKRDRNVGATKLIRNFKTTPKERFFS